jgi:hypothetical protein
VPDTKRDIALPQFAITLVFWRKFGAPHWHKYSEVEKDVRYHLDTNLVGRNIVFIPTLTRKTFEIGRASECWIRLGFNPESKRDATIPEDFYDGGGAVAQPLFNHWSRKHVTFELITKRQDGHTVGDWYIYPGGEFWNKDTGEREWSDSPNFVYLEGRRLAGGKDPTPLFPGNSKTARVQLGDAGKIIIAKGRLGSHTTSWPNDIWIGEGWPDMLAIAQARVAAAKAEVATARIAHSESPASVEGSPSHRAETGHTLADVLVVILHGPEGIDSRLWWVLCGSGALLALWIHKQ